jgi:hypothetical protein
MIGRVNASSSSYATPQEYPNGVLPAISTNDKFNLFCHNVQGIKLKWDDILTFTAENKNPFSLAGLTETWLSSQDDMSPYCFPGFEAIHLPRHVTKCSGGIKLFVNDSISYKRRGDLESIFNGVVERCRSVYLKFLESHLQ